jgi:hypothetical protein
VPHVNKNTCGAATVIACASATAACVPSSDGAADTEPDSKITTVWVVRTSGWRALLASMGFDATTSAGDTSQRKLSDTDQHVVYVRTRTRLASIAAASHQGNVS